MRCMEFLFLNDIINDGLLENHNSNNNSAKTLVNYCTYRTLYKISSAATNLLN